MVKNRDLKSDDKMVYYDGEYHEDFLIQNGDLLVGMDGDFTPRYWNKGQALLNQRVGRVVAKDKNAERFFEYFLAIQLKEIEEKTARTTVKHLSHKAVNAIHALIPSSKEQQKIAACLSSLDALIAAHRDKLAALKHHKTGLLQNLFPQAGQDVPNYRFPAFREDGVWEETPFKELIKLYRGSSPRPIREYLTEDEDGVNWIKIGDTGDVTDFVIRKVSEKISPKGAEKSRAVTKGELILANSMSYGHTYEVDIDGCIYDGWFVLREYEGVLDKQFLLQVLNSEYMQGQYKKFAAGGIVQNISSEIVYSTSIPLTSLAEQQKIAACLSAVDELIAAQDQKIEQLEEHKKGLMQGLFPSVK